MRRFRDLPVRQKLLAMILVASLAAVAVTALAVLVYEATSFRPKVLEELRTETEILSRNLAAALSFLDPKAAEEDLQALAARQEILAARVYDRAGDAFATYLREDAESSPPDRAQAAGHEFHATHIDVWQTIFEEDEAIGRLFVRRQLPPLYARLPQYGLMGGAVFVALLAASVLLITTLRGTISAPIQELARAVTAVRDLEDYGARARRRSADEIGELTDAFNQMLDVIQARDAALREAYDEQQNLQQRLVQAQKLESIGRLAGGVAHDFNNYLTIITGSTDMLLGQLPPDDPRRRPAANTLRAAEQAADLTRQLLAFARRQVIEPQVIDPNRLLANTRGMLTSLVGEGIEMRLELEPDVQPVRVDPSQMTQVLVNLAANARDAMPSGGRLTIRTENRQLPYDPERRMEPGPYVVLSVSDTGIGIDEETRRNLFEPFFTTKERGKGTGLGLATCYGIVKQSGGYIWVDSLPGQGATFEIFLKPASGEVLEQPPRVDAPKPRNADRETVLVVEDNPLVRATTVEALRNGGYQVLEAECGPDALRLLEGHEDPIDLLLTDVVMPQMSGREVAARTRSLRPDIKVLYVSGFTADVVIDGELDGEGIAFLQKPYSPSLLIDRVRGVLDA